MSEIRYCPLSQVDFEAFTAAFNRAYSDYLMPVVMTSASFRALMARDDLDPAASVVALDGDTIVGTGLLGLRAPIGWIGGMGVIPGYRRRGIGRQMMIYLLERAREHGLSKVGLEVIEANHGAHALYYQLGFVDTRYLLILERIPTSLPDLPPTYRVEEQAPEDLLEYYDAFHDVPNCWQRHRASLVGLSPHLEGWAVWFGNQVAGYAVGMANHHEVRLADLAADPNSDRVLAAQTLLVYLHEHHWSAYSSIYNISEDDPVLPAYQATGYTTVMRQIEMEYTLK
ncbi:MAG: GNAT family N-acetyltransferase [Chloroflexi bacterium]|nr:GNAT family N-acetyltransferase [Chloroflexota bacterium]